MADRFPLILNTSANQIQEIASGDTLDLTGNNISNAGVITATSFSGPIVAGAGTSNITAGIITAVTFKGDGDLVELDVDGHTNLDNVNISGVSTFAGAIDLNSDLDVDGHTNLDNVNVAGVATFASTVNANLFSGSGASLTGIANANISNSAAIAGSKINPNFVAQPIYTSGTIVSGDISITDATPTLTFNDTDDNPDFSIGVGSNALIFQDITNSVVRFKIASDGKVSVTNDFDVDGHTELDNVSVAGVTTFASGNVQLASDSQRLQLGSTQNLWMYHTGTSGGAHGLIQNDYGTMYMLSNNWEFRQKGTNHTTLKISGNQAVQLYYQNNSKLATTSTGVTVSGIDVQNDLDVNGHTNLDNVSISGIATITGDLRVGGALTYEDVTNVDSIGIVTARQGVRLGVDGTSSANYISVGAGNDLKIWHQSSNNHSYISETGSGSLIVLADDFYVQDTSTGTMISAKEGAEVNLHHNTALKLSTTSTGANVTSANDAVLQVTTSGTASTDDARLELITQESSFIIQNDRSLGTDGALTVGDGTKTYLRATKDAEVSLYYDSSPVFTTTNQGAVIPTGNGLTINGGTGNRTGDAVLYVDKTNNNDWCQKLKTNTGSSNDYGLRIECNSGSSFPLVVNNGSNAFRVAGNGNVYANEFHGDGSNLTNIVTGITTEQVTPSSNVATLNLAKDDHKIVASGTYTIDVSGGTEASSHTLRIENSGTANVGFSTYFKFPSGGTPSLPTASGAISLVSFSVHKVGSVGIATVLLAGASVNFS